MIDINAKTLASDTGSKSKHARYRRKQVNKTELVAQIVADTELSQANAASVIDAMLNSIQNALKAGDTVSLIGFGSFSVTDRAARKGRNPATGEEIQIAASRVPTFKAGSKLKDAVNVKPEKKKTKSKKKKA